MQDDPYHTWTLIELDPRATSVIRFLQAEKRCAELFGPAGGRWFVRGYCFYFRHDRDAHWFELAT